jgi:hypothetical protein
VGASLKAWGGVVPAFDRNLVNAGRITTAGDTAVAPILAAIGHTGSIQLMSSWAEDLIANKDCFLSARKRRRQEHSLTFESLAD